MMKEEFDFKKVGKRMPYQVPSDFFDDITEKTLTEAESRSGGEKKYKISALWTLSVAASVALLMAVGYFIYTGSAVEEKSIAQSAVKETPVAVVPQVSEVPVAPDTMTIPEVKEPVRMPAVKAEDKLAKIKEKETPVQELASADKPASFDEILKSMSDEEILQLAALAEADQYVYEETFSDE